VKTLHGSLAAMLASGVTTIARCWRLQRGDGAVFGFTDHDRTLSFAGTDYAPETGFMRSEFESRLGLAVDTMEVEGAISSAAISEDDIALGRWDNAAVEIWAVDWSDTANRVLLRAGNLGEIMRGDVVFMAELRGLAHHLNQERGRTYQRLCDAVLGDTRCGVDLDDPNHAGDGAVMTVRDDRLLTVSGIDAYDDDWFSQGLLTWSSGANIGTAIEVRRHAVGDGVLLELWEKAARPIEAGDAFLVTTGCARTLAICTGKFGNAVNFRGFPHVPGNDFALSVAKRDEKNDGGSFFAG
jgi:uncharacterized phage protein (TIGR02218 family)